MLVSTAQPQRGSHPPATLFRSCLYVGFAGLLLGLGSFVRSDSPTVPLARTPCQGCHAMAPHHASWKLGNHAKVATCEDCHLPHGTSLRRSHAMAADGLRHGAMTVLDTAPAVTRLRAAGAEVAQKNCLRCHPLSSPGSIAGGASSKAPRPLRQPATAAHADQNRGCLDCHRETSHARGTAG